MVAHDRKQNIARKVRLCEQNGLRPKFWSFMISKAGIVLMEWDTPPNVPQAETLPLRSVLSGANPLEIRLPILPQDMRDMSCSALMRLPMIELVSLA